MEMQRAAAALPGGHYHFATVALEHGHAGLMQAGERNIGVERAAAEGIDIAARQRASVIGEPGMEMQRAAAALPGGHYHFATVALEHAHAGLMQAGERNIGHAAGEEGHAVAANTVGGEW